MIERFVSDIKITFAKENIDDQTATILPNCADLFLFYKKSLVQCTELSNHNPMLTLATVFQKYLKEYATKILEMNLPKYRNLIIKEIYFSINNIKFIKFIELAIQPLL